MGLPPDPACARHLTRRVEPNRSTSLKAMARRAGILVISMTVVAAGCGGSSERVASQTSTAGPPGTSTAPAITNAKLPPGAVGPVHTDEGPAAAEASPEAPAEGPSTGTLSGSQEEAVAQAVRDYVDALDRHDADRVCALFAPGALRLRELPVRRGGCVASLRASLGHHPRGGAPAWRRTEIISIKAVSVEGEGARVTATVTHHFADRKYVSVEDDVVYLEQPSGGRWLISKPSGTLYRAVGYAEPPLSAFEPPAQR